MSAYPAIPFVSYFEAAWFSPYPAYQITNGGGPVPLNPNAVYPAVPWKPIFNSKDFSPYNAYQLLNTNTNFGIGTFTGIVDNGTFTCGTNSATTGNLTVGTGTQSSITVTTSNATASSFLQLSNSAGNGYLALEKGNQFLIGANLGDMIVQTPAGNRVLLASNNQLIATFDGSKNTTLGGALSMTSGTMSCGTNAATVGALMCQSMKKQADTAYGTIVYRNAATTGNLATYQSGIQFDLSNGTMAETSYAQINGNVVTESTNAGYGGFVADVIANGAFLGVAAHSNAALYLDSTSAYINSATLKTKAFNAGTNAATVGALASTSIANSGTMNCTGAATFGGTITTGTNAATVGALNSSSIANSGTMNCTGAATFGGTITTGTNAATVGALNSSSIANSGTLSCTGAATFGNSLTTGTNAATMGSLTVGPDATATDVLVSISTANSTHPILARFQNNYDTLDVGVDHHTGSFGDYVAVSQSGDAFVRYGVSGAHAFHISKSNSSVMDFTSSGTVQINGATAIGSTLTTGTNAATVGALVSAGGKGTLQNGIGTLPNAFTSSTSAQTVWSMSNSSTTNGTFRAFIWDSTLNTGTTASFTDGIFTKANTTYAGPYNLQSSTNAAITATSLALSGSNIQFTGNNTTSSMYYSLLQIS